jgi:glycerophosphoryl diester phosphodiesterase/beta-glucanase (GH16 family)
MRFLLISIPMLLSFFSHGQTWHDNKIIAHRGAWKKLSLPQNSIASMKSAFEGKYHGAEFDVRMTADNVLVVVHDPKHANLDIESNTYDKLNQTKLANGEDLPTLISYIKKGKKQKSSKLILEIKISPTNKERSLFIADKTVALVKRLKVKKWITYISFDIDILRQVLKNDPAADTQYLNGDLSPSQLAEIGVGGMDYHYTAYHKNPFWIDQCRQLGLKTNVWTVNDEDNIRYFLQLGIDYITTDEPEKAILLAKEVKERGLVWSDEFMYEGLPDSSIWTYNVGGHGWGNQELQYYTDADPDNVFVSDGKLTITARQERFEDNDYTSTRLVTYGDHNIKYGRIDVKAKLPKGRGSWPAIWTLGQNIATVGWPACGEIDIMEHVGYDSDTIHASTHSIEHNHIKKTQKTSHVKIENPYDSFHIYSVDFDDKGITFFLDNKLFYKILRAECKDWPFDEPHYLLLNIAVGGFWGGAKGIDDSIWPQSMQVDYVRVWR